MRWGRFPALRTVLLVVSILAALLASLRPSLQGERITYSLTLVVDITGSMNARDQRIGGAAVSRLDRVRAVLPEVIARLPCGSRVGLAIFTERRSVSLFAPVEVCENFAPVTDAIRGLDWRMAWEGDSRIAEGVRDGLDLARAQSSDILFLTDGQEAPPLPWDWRPPVHPGPGAGLLVGVGGAAPVPIPKYDERGREIGVYAATDVPHESRTGAPPPDAAGRPGWHPRNNPYGEAGAGSEHLTQLREEHLRLLARHFGLGYVRLQTADALVQAIRTQARPLAVPAMRDLSALPGAAALLALLLSYLRMRSPGDGRPSVFRSAIPTARGVPVSSFRILLFVTALAGSGLVPLPALAHGPTPQKVAEHVDIRAPCELVWTKIKDFGAIGQWHSAVRAVRASGASAPGSTRVLTLENGETITERLDDVDGTSQSLSYRLSVENLKALPVSFYTARMGVTRSEDGRGCRVDWDGRFYRGDTTNEPPPELSDEAAVTAMTHFFQTGLAGLAKAME